VLPSATPATTAPSAPSDDIYATIQQFARQHDGVIDGPLTFRTVGGRATEKQRPVLRPNRPDRLRNFEREAHAAFQISAITVVAQVRERAEELVNQIPMGSVNFANIEACIDASKSRIPPHIDHVADVTRRHLDWG
jgi:hypothetical protein